MSIKSRRLFAILVITAMVLTMLPVSAFAANYSYAASYAEVNKTSVRIDSSSSDPTNYITFTVVLLNSSGNYVTGNIDDLYIKSSRDAETVEVRDEDGDWITISADIDSPTGALLSNAYADEYGEVKVKVWSGLAGSAKISFHKGTTGYGEDEKAGPTIDEKTITFTSATAKADKVILTIDEEETADFPYVGDEITLRARVTSGGSAVEGVTVTFQKSRNDGSWQTIGSKETNRQGVATLKVVENESGKYEYRARVSGVSVGTDPDEDDDVDVINYKARTPVVLKKITEDGTKIAVDKEYTVKFRMEDYLGNVNTEATLTLEVIEAPSASALEDEKWDVTQTDDDKNMKYGFTPDATGKEYGKSSLENLEKTLRREQLRKDLGMITSTALKQLKAGLLQAEQGIKNLTAGEESMRRTFLRLLGMPLNFQFSLTSENVKAGGISPAMTELPDFTGSIKYQSSLENLERKKEELEDTSTYDIIRYQMAEANVELAEIQLGKTLQGLEDNFNKRLESLLLAEENIEIAAFELENKEREHKEAKIRYDLGMISAMELENAELSLLEAGIKHETAILQHYLEYRAFLLAREGIEVEPFSLQ